MLVDDRGMLRDVEQLLQDRFAFGFRQTFDAGGHEAGDIKRFAAGLRVGDEDRLLVVADLREIDHIEVQSFTPLVVVHLQDLAAFQLVAQRAWDHLVGLVLVGEAGFAAPCRELLSIKHRGPVRFRIVAGIVMEPHLAIAERAEGLAVLDDVRHVHEGRVVVATGQVAHGGAFADGDLAEYLARRDLVLVFQILATEYDDDVILEGFTNGGLRPFIEWFGEVHPSDLGADHGV